MLLTLDNERILLERIASDDEQAFKAVYAHYWNDVYSVALAYLKSPAWAEDILQEVFVKLWNKRSQLPAVDKLNAYLFIMVRNELVAALRSKARDEERYREYILNLSNGALQADTGMAAAELRVAVEVCLQELSPQQQLIFDLSRNKGLSLDEIAAQTGRSKKTVSNILTMVLNHIRVRLHEKGLLHPSILLLAEACRIFFHDVRDMI